MKLRRMFITYGVKGTENYLNSQKKYELFRTLIYFSISVSLLIAGWVQTGSRANLLSIIAILGCLPASKSAVNTIMFYRFHSASKETIDAVKPHEKGLSALYDCVFTSYKKNFEVAHVVVKDNIICGYSENKAFDETAFYSHILDILHLDGHKEVTVKVFTDLKKYIDRLDQINELEEKNHDKTVAVLDTLRNVML